MKRKTNSKACSLALVEAYRAVQLLSEEAHNPQAHRLMLPNAVWINDPGAVIPYRQLAPAIIERIAWTNGL